MSNPCVSRWGLNTFWYNYWYSDLFYADNVQQDKMFIVLVQIYLKYGTAYTSTFTYNLFWYKTAAQPKNTNLHHYYRWVLTKGREPDEVFTSRLRLETAETFQTRVSVLRLNSWFILNIYWFQPDKFLTKRERRSKALQTATSLVSVRSTLIPLSKLSFLVRKVSSNPVYKTTIYNF